MLTRSGVAKALGKSIATVRRLEGLELHPTVDAQGVHRFPKEQVERLRQRIHQGARVSAARGTWLNGAWSHRSGRPKRRNASVSPKMLSQEAIDSARSELAEVILELLLRHQSRPSPVVIEYLTEILDE